MRQQDRPSVVSRYNEFGAGHATFVYLRQFPVDKIKIDKTFLGHLASGSSDALIVRSMITMARSLGLDVLAERIETLGIFWKSAVELPAAPNLIRQTLAR